MEIPAEAVKSMISIRRLTIVSRPLILKASTASLAEFADAENAVSGADALRPNKRVYFADERSLRMTSSFCLSYKRMGK